jgi:CO/xanthine dehydrogenase Mo-binding subunit
MKSIIGAGLPRIDAWDKVLGAAMYPGDLSMGGALHGAVVFSERAHARMVRLDTTAARAYPGVMAVFTHADVPCNEFGINVPDQRVLTEGKVRSFGDPVALIYAETAEAAQAARSLVRVVYDDLPGVYDPREAMQPSAPLVHEERSDNVYRYVKVRKGDAAEALAGADVTVEGYYTTPFEEHAYLQPEAGLAYLDGDGRIVIHVASQWPQDDLHQIAHALRLPQARIKEVVGPIGGAFGGREDISIQIFLALGAHLLRRPVKIVYSREDSVRGHGKRHPFFMRYRTGARSDGLLVAQEIELIADCGAYASTSGPVLANAVSFASGPYAVPNVSVDGYSVYTNNPTTMAFRGFGANQPCVAYELQMEKLAEALHMDPVELRLKNVLVNGSVGPLGSAIPAGVGIKETLEKAALAACWRRVGRRWMSPRLPAASAPHKRRGIGVACGWKNVGYSFGFDDKATCRVDLSVGRALCPTQPPGEEAHVVCNARPTDVGAPVADVGHNARPTIVGARIAIGVAEVGQGTTTGLAQIAAETLGIPFECVRMVVSDSDVAPDAGSSSASRQLYVSGNAVRRACLKALDELSAAPAGTERIEVEATFHARERRPTTPFDPETGLCEPHISLGWVTNVAEVEVDTETGEVELLRVWAAQDVGKAINRQLIEQQIDGGVVMGQGYGLMEDFVVDKGRILTRNLTEYLIPTALDAVADIRYIIVEEPDPTGPFGAKGVGEQTTIAVPPAILAAIHNATGAWINSLPATAERVQAAFTQARLSLTEKSRERANGPAKGRGYSA